MITCHFSSGLSVCICSLTLQNMIRVQIRTYSLGDKGYISVPLGEARDTDPYP